MSERLTCLIVLLAMLSGCSEEKRIGLAHSSEIPVFEQAVLDDFASKHANFQRPGNKVQVIVLVDREEFRCTACFHGFLNIIDELSERGVDERDVAVLIRQEIGVEAARFSKRLERWKTQLSIPYPVLIDTGSLFEASAVQSNALLIFSPTGSLLGAWKIPIDPTSLSTIGAKLDALTA